MAVTLDGFALVLGASSGIGAATARALARAGMDIIGVHLDRRATQPLADAVRADVEAAGRTAWFFNVNAADDAKRRAVLADVAERLAARAKGESVRVLMHSIAFGSLRPMVGGDGDETLTRIQIEMTLDVMATSLVYWAQDLLAMGALASHGRVFAMTSGGSTQALPSYGAVGAAKAALEAYVRQLAVEGAGRGFTANAVCAGVTRTPALERIPGHELLVERALAKHPQGRLTTPDDVARCIVALASPETDWMTGNVIRVDGGEGAAG
jgi:NAD(P)-dependent dehydrogenase (short-subunit alcohol dehydrogenase family)